jgi:hypothetical protein
MFSRLVEESDIADQWMLDRTLKRLRKLRWIGKEQEAEKIRHVLRDMRLPQLLEELRRGGGEAKKPAKIPSEVIFRQPDTAR